ncbi:S-adenosyl-L-methionine-dependent methyltransferase [Lineolata rhizophorae]|uniref:type I protein arginine methyltransferase n=1 Tax=Lineolata rhizophorae TaxID=578093 RepID=A0A6A6P455_9PEZI|nr:S-adenosyl-L-methionine-dependent methyltransferase [Lineolata rhizophorae]
MSQATKDGDTLGNSDHEEENVQEKDDESDSEGYEDVDDSGSEDSHQIMCFFDERLFNDGFDMLCHVETEHGLNFCNILRTCGQEFYVAVKLVNYLRHCGLENKVPRVKSYKEFDDEKYMTPVFKDDALIVQLDEILERELVQSPKDAKDEEIARLNDQIMKLEANNRRLADINLSSLKDRVSAMGISEHGDTSSSSSKRASEDERQKTSNKSYFDSYSYNEIHETMLKDTIRTDAYRDFIYENKDLFKGKIVLDVGCGTGILSMFCARAGAAMVYAVDNSSIIEKAIANVYNNGLGDQIKCIRGMIEEVDLPDEVEEVDIIVSEWMGYGLLFESMLDAVLIARDRWLAPGGLMVPSYCVLRIAPIQDPDQVDGVINWWNNVYGFNMTAMKDKIYEDVVVKIVADAQLVGDSDAFCDIDLHTVRPESLQFRKHFNPEGLIIDEDASHLPFDGFVIWFDTYFQRERRQRIDPSVHAHQYVAEGRPGCAFSTGPFSPPTHWRSCVLILDDPGDKKRQLKPDDVVQGTITFKKGPEDKRNLEITVSWDTLTEARRGRKTGYRGDQTWAIA